MKFLFKKILFVFISFLYFSQTHATNTPLEYTINLLWVNKQLASDKVFPEKRNANNGEERFLENLEGWSRLHPHTQIIVWYDNANETAVFNTKELLLQKNLQNVTLKHVRDLPQVNEHYNKLWNKNIPLYYKIDLYKLIISYEMLKNDPSKVLVFSDFDIIPLSENELFDEETLENLMNFALVFTNKGAAGFENSFHLMLADEHLIESLMIINEYCLMIISYIDRQGTTFNLQASEMSQLIYSILDHMFFRLYYLKRNWLTSSNSLWLTSPNLRDDMKNYIEQKINTLISFPGLTRTMFLNLAKFDDESETKLNNKLLYLSNGNELKLRSDSIENLLKKTDYIEHVGSFYSSKEDILFFKDKEDVSIFYLNATPRGRPNDLPVLHESDEVAVFHTKSRPPVPGKNIQHSRSSDTYN